MRGGRPGGRGCHVAAPWFGGREPRGQGSRREGLVGRVELRTVPTDLQPNSPHAWTGPAEGVSDGGASSLPRGLPSHLLPVERGERVGVGGLVRPLCGTLAGALPEIGTGGPVRCELEHGGRDGRCVP